MRSQWTHMHISTHIHLFIPVHINWKRFYSLILWEEAGIHQSEKNPQTDLLGWCMLQTFPKLMETTWLIFINYWTKSNIHRLGVNITLVTVALFTIHGLMGKSMCQAVRQMFIHGRKVTRTYLHIHRAAGFLQEALLLNRGTMLLYYLLLTCFATIIYNFNGEGDIKAQNFSTYPECSSCVCFMGGQAQSLRSCSDWFPAYFRPQVWRIWQGGFPSPWSNAVCTLVFHSSSVYPGKRHRRQAAERNLPGHKCSKEWYVGQARRKRWEKKPAKGQICFGVDLKSIYVPSNV